MKKQLAILIILFASFQLTAQMENPINYVHEKPTSFGGAFVKLLLHITTNKKNNKNAKKLADSTYQSEAAAIPKKFYKEFNIEKSVIEGRDVFTISPKGKKTTTYVLYMHGGAYINNILKAHWSIIGELVRRTNATLVVPDYLLTPVYTVHESMAFMEKVYNTLLLQTSPENVIFMGDSAGGGFALALAEKLKREKKQQPEQLILISPWLDITTSNPEMKAYEKKDPMLKVENVNMIGKYWGGGMDEKNYLVSPMFGDLQGLGKISVFIGGHDILFPDIQKFKNIMEQNKIPFNYFEYPKMFHVWIGATFLRESKSAFNQIAELILKD